jgi:hypothetical protein
VSFKDKPPKVRENRTVRSEAVIFSSLPESGLFEMVIVGKSVGNDALLHDGRQTS